MSCSEGKERMKSLERRWMYGVKSVKKNAKQEKKNERKRPQPVERL